MKLTFDIAKRSKLDGFVRDYEDYGRINRCFDTSDFVELENAVILTVEEAKLIQTLARRQLFVWDTKTLEAMTKLRKQIEESEGRND